MIIREPVINLPEIEARYLRELQEEQRRRLGQPEHTGEADRVIQPIEDRPRDPPRALEPGEERTPTTNNESSKRVGVTNSEPGNGSRLREDPNTPGTYIGYSRNPPAPTHKQPKQ